MSRTIINLGWEMSSLSNLQKLFNTENAASLFELLMAAGLDVHQHSNRIVVGWRLSSSNTHFMIVKKSVRAVSDQDRLTYGMINDIESELLFQTIKGVNGEPSIIEMTL